MKNLQKKKIFIQKTFIFSWTENIYEYFLCTIHIKHFTWYKRKQHLYLPLLACFIRNSVWLSFSSGLILFFLRPHGQRFLGKYPSLCILLFFRHFISLGILRPYSCIHWYFCMKNKTTFIQWVHNIDHLILIYMFSQTYMY